MLCFLGISRYLVLILVLHWNKNSHVKQKFQVSSTYFENQLHRKFSWNLPEIGLSEFFIGENKFQFFSATPLSNQVSFVTLISTKLNPKTTQFPLGWIPCSFHTFTLSKLSNHWGETQIKHYLFFCVSWIGLGNHINYPKPSSGLEVSNRLDLVGISTYGKLLKNFG